MKRLIWTGMAFFLLAAQAIAADAIVARVNGDVVTASELDALLAQTPPPLTPMTASQKRQLKLETVSVLVDEKIIRQFLKQQAISIDPMEIDKQYAGLEATLREQGKSKTAYFRETGLSEEKVRENFKLMLQLAKFLDSQITEEKLKNFFAENRDFFEQTTLRTSHIVLRVPADSTTEERQKAKSKLASIRTEILTKKITFAEAATKHSQCPSAPKGGDIGFIGRKFQVDEAYAKTAFSQDIGELSDIVESDFGYHLIVVTERKQGKNVKFEDVSREVRDCFEAETRQNLLASLLKKAKVEITLP